MGEPNSFNHEIRALSLEELADLDRKGLRCPAPKCGERLLVECYYRFRGRTGRLGEARREQCAAHGRHFAERYELEFPDLPSLPEETAALRGLAKEEEDE